LIIHPHTDTSVSPIPQANIRKLIYRSKQRGWLELDLLIGMWAESHLPHLSDTHLNAYSQFLDEENPDLFKWLTGQLPPPPHMSANPAFMMLSTHVQQQLEEYQAPQTAAVKGKDWVRGWDDYKEKR
jgi:succinate dehydrogenase flavin-adding protein (antitoxin of CptAB toxin-antitoxin module)